MRPTVTCRIAFASDPFDAVPVWDDVSSDVVSADITRGRNSELDRMEAGTAVVVLNNESGDYWPKNAAGAYYPDVLPLKRINIRATYNAVTYDLFTGYIESYTPQFKAPFHTYMVLRCVDLIKSLSRLLLNDAVGYAEELSGTRVDNVLTDLGWLGGTDLDAGIGTMQASGVLENVNALDHLFAVQDSEAGIIYIAGDGDVQFEDRHHRVLGAHLASQAIFGTGNHHYHSADVGLDDSFLYNYITIERLGGAVQAALDLASMATYGQRNLAKTQLLFTTDAESLAYAEYLRGRYSDPYLTVKSLIVEPEADEPNLYPFCLGFDISTRITVRIDQASIFHDFFIEGVKHHYGGGPWRTTWQLSEADLFLYWKLGIPLFGELGMATRLYF